MGLDPETAAYVENIMGPIGATLACIMFSSSFPVMQTIIRNGSVGEYSYMPYFVQTCHTLLWTCYAFADYQDGKMFWPAFCNGLGFLIASSSLTCFTIFCNGPQRLSLLKVCVAPILLDGLFGFYLLACREKWLISVAQQLAMWINVIMVGGPCAGIVSALQLRSTEFLPLSLGVSTLVNSVPWMLFGFSVDNIAIWFPNACGILCGGTQVSVYLYLTRCIGAPEVVHSNMADNPRLQALSFQGHMFSLVSEEGRARANSEPPISGFRNDFPLESADQDRAARPRAQTDTMAGREMRGSQA
mmetsp:Transcript_98420/g.175284  ORF Transcript_98420/g.175284 Transcript_98420/m.175284 type:complete len:301 (-) Transcript_98420:54-956(-)